MLALVSAALFFSLAADIDVSLAAAPVRDAAFYGINAERPHEDVYNTDMLSVGDSSWQSYTIEATVKINSTGVAAGSAGIAIRSDGAGNRYFLGIYPNEDQWKLLGPDSHVLMYGPGTFDVGQPYALKAAVTPGNITVTVNGANYGTSDSARVSGAAGLLVRSADADFSSVKINGAAQNLANWSAAHAAAWSSVSGGSARGNVLLNASQLAVLSPELDARFKMISDAGAKEVRMMLSWAEIQPQSSTQPYYWSYADTFAILARKYNLEIIPIVLFAPRWAVAQANRGSPYYHAYPPVDGAGNFSTTDFANFVDAAVKRYKRNGELAAQLGWSSSYHGQAQYFEIGPEFNLGRIFHCDDSGQCFATAAWWMGTLPQFVDLLKAGHDAVKGQCPTCLVVSGASADDTIPNYFIGNDNGSGCDPGRCDGYEPYLGSTRLRNPDGKLAWRQTAWQGIEDLYTEIESRPLWNSPGQYFDILNIHSYMWKGFTSDNPYTVDRFVNCSFYADDCHREWYQTRLRETVRIMQQHHDNRDIWLSETGFASSKPLGDEDDFLGFLSEDDQARALNAAYSVAAGFPEVKKVFWWQGYDTFYTANLSMIREDLSAKPSYWAFGLLQGRTLNFTSGYSFPWYDNYYAADWVLFANPSGAPASAALSLTIGGTPKSLSPLPGYGSGQLPPGSVLYARYPGLMSGPVRAGYSGESKVLVSQRTLWAGSSLEEVPGTETSKISNLFYWPWYDERSPGFKNWVLVSNPGITNVYYKIKIRGSDVGTGLLAPGSSTSPRFPGAMGGPVELEAWSDGVGGNAPAFVTASQRVLINGDTAFNEQPGTPAYELSSDYHWTWYDERSPGSRDWVLISNPPGAGTQIYYEIRIGSQPVARGGPIAPGDSRTPEIPRAMGGPVELKTFSDAAHTTAAVSIASQRTLWGPSFEEMAGYRGSAQTSTYHWTWYDMQSPGSSNWVLIANPLTKADGTSNSSGIYYEIKISGQTAASGGPIAAGGTKPFTFPGVMSGPVEVKTFGDPTYASPAGSIVSQRVLWNGYFNEVMGASLN